MSDALSASCTPTSPTRVTIVGPHPLTVDAPGAPMGHQRVLTFRQRVRLGPGTAAIGSSLKIDRSFVGAMGAGDADSEIIVQSTLDLAHNLGLAVVAEGVETPQVYDRLASLGCGHAQGYFISRPLPNEALLAWLDKHKPEKGRPVPVTAPAGAPVLSQR